MYTTKVVCMSDEPSSRDRVVESARRIVERIVWCSVATVSPLGVPRTRLLHPVWFWEEHVPLALVATRPTPVKVRHLETNAGVSCFYWDPAQDTVAIDAVARWVEPAERERAWRRISQVDTPVGFDPATVWPDGPASSDCAFLHLDAHRIIVRSAGRSPLLWRR